MTSLSARFPAMSVEDWTRAVTSVPAATHSVPSPPFDRAAMHAELAQLGFDDFDCDPIRYPRNPPTPLEWKAHLDALESSTRRMQERSFDMDTASMVEASSPATACESGSKACVGSFGFGRVTGLTRPIVLERLQPPHPPYCVLCLRAMFANAIRKDKLNREYEQKQSELLQPGSTPYVQKQLQQIQSFYNLRDQKGEYSSKFMMLGDDNDIIVLPMARVSLKHLVAVQRPGDGRFQITQEALRYIHDPGTDVQPGETVEQLKERVRYVDHDPVEWLEERDD